MRLALVSDNNSMAVLEIVKEKLLREIVDLESECFYVPLVTDIPFKASELAEAFDIIFTFTSFENENMETKAVLDKLLEIELKAGTKIIKGFQRIEEMPEVEQIDEEKAAMAEKWVQVILSHVFQDEKEE